MSEKTIADRMFLQNAKSIQVINGGVHPTLIQQLPQDLLHAAAGPYDAILVLCMHRKDLEQYLPAAKQGLSDTGSLWIAFLKSTAAKATDIDRESIEAYLKENDITAVAMISVDGDWSALRAKRITL